MDDLKSNGLLYPYVRFFNAANESEKLDFYSCNMLIAAGIPFGAFTSYIKSEKGNKSFKVTRAGRKDDVLGQISLDLSVGDVYSICAINQNGSINLYVVNEPKALERPEYGHIRVCMLAENIPQVNIYANDEPIISDMNYLDVSKYINIIPGKYVFRIKNSEDGNVILSCGTQVVKVGKYNSMYVIGNYNSPSDLKCIFTIDAASYTGFYL